VGLIAGGVLTGADLFGWGWRSVFLVNIPIALATLVAAARVVPETRDPHAGRPDLAGALLLSASILAIAFPLVEGRSNDWPVWGWLVLASGIAGLVVLGVVEQRRSDERVAPLLRPRLLRIPAFSAGLAVMGAFAAGLQGFFLILAVWLQAGMGFSPLRAGLTALAFSLGSFVLAPAAVPLARRYGRLVLFAGGVLMALGALGVRIGATHVDNATDFWPIVPGLLIAGLGLSLLIIPLANVVLAAVPHQVAGGAGGTLSTLQQLGGALGIAVVGTLFFGHLTGHSFTSAFRYSTPLVIALFAIAALLSLALPGTALSEEELVDVH
jgi:MFS family permease